MQWCRLNVFSPKIGNNGKMLALTTSIQHSTEGLSQYNDEKN